MPVIGIIIPYLRLKSKCRKRDFFQKWKALFPALSVQYSDGGSRRHFVLCGQHQKSVFHQRRHHRLYVNIQLNAEHHAHACNACYMGAFFRFPRACAGPFCGYVLQEGIIHAVQHLNCTGADNGVAAEGRAVVAGNQGIL